jgi:hypothetical protein
MRIRVWDGFSFFGVCHARFQSIALPARPIAQRRPGSVEWRRVPQGGESGTENVSQRERKVLSFFQKP